MTLKRERAQSLAETIACGDEACRKALEEGRAVDLVVPSGVWRDDRKLMLRSTLPAGVHVQTYDEWVAGLWGLYGDGRQLVAPLQRRVLLRPLVQRIGLLPGSPSAGLVDQLARFVQEAIAPGVSPRGKLDGAQGKVLSLVGAYEEELAARGLVEQAQAEAALVGSVAMARAVVLEAADLTSPHRRSFVDALAGRLPVTEIGRVLVAHSPEDGAMAGPFPDELAALRATLYTGEGGITASGAVLVGEAHGAHASGSVLCEVVSRLLERGERPGDIVLVFPDAADSYPHVQRALARDGIPFRAHFDLPAAQTPFGSAFSRLVKLRDDPEGAESYELLAGLLGLPYAGIDGRDARALQMRWRERAGSTPEERLRDVTEGFAQGNADAKTTKERLAPLAELLSADYASCVRLMFDHAAASRRGVDALVDDRAAAGALLGYLSACESFGAEPAADEAANLPVPLDRCFGDPATAVLIADAASLGPSHVGNLVVCELDAGHYPMARQAGPFDTTLEKLGILAPDERALEQRLLLSDLIEHSEHSIAFCRATHDPEGNESVQSALWDEVMTAYRTAADEAADRAIQEVPEALAPYAVRLSEAEVFARGVEPSAAAREVRRGHLANADEVTLLTRELSGKEMPFSPTGIEDYYRCPYRWFACRRVGYNGMDNEFDAAAQGNLAHATLERFYRELKARGMERVTPGNLERALELASQALDEQVRHDEGRNRGGIFLRTERDRYGIEEIRKMLLDFVRRDATFLPGFVPTYFELTLGKGTGTMLSYGGVPVRGKVDRIDVDAQGRAVVIDYKLSALSQGYGLDPEHDIPGRIQTDIYARLVQRHFDLLGVPLRVVGSVYRSYSKNCLRGAYSRSIDWGADEKVVEEKDALPRPGRSETYDEYLGQVEETVSACMERLRAGDITPDPLDGDTKSVCEFCKALPFCPRGES